MKCDTNLVGRQSIRTDGEWSCLKYWVGVAADHFWLRGKW